MMSMDNLNAIMTTAAGMKGFVEGIKNGEIEVNKQNVVYLLAGISSICNQLALELLSMSDEEMTELMNSEDFKTKIAGIFGKQETVNL